MGNWFADKLNVPQQQRSTYVPKYSQVQQPSTRPVSPDGLWEWDGVQWVSRQQPGMPPPPPPGALPPNAAAVKAKQANDFCPQCQSDNGYYFSPKVNAPKRCFECGYVDGSRDFAQSSSFDSNPTPRGSAAPGVQQVNPGTNQFGRGGV